MNASPMGVNYNENFFNGYGYSKGIEFLAQKNSGEGNRLGELYLRGSQEPLRCLFRYILSCQPGCYT